MHIRPVELSDQLEWLRLRMALWPDCPPEKHSREMADYFGGDPNIATWVAVRPEGGLGGFLEASLRPYADGCETRPVGYVEGWYIDEDLRRQGVGRELLRAAEEWARARGCREMASDCSLDNEVSLRAHLASGFEEVDRAIRFRKWL